jgi:hypothetical protein
MHTSKKITNAIKVEFLILCIGLVFLLFTLLSPDSISIWKILISVGFLIGSLLIAIRVFRSSQLLTYGVSFLIIGVYLFLGLQLSISQILQYRLVGTLDLFEHISLFLGLELSLAGVMLLVVVLSAFLKNRKE